MTALRALAPIAAATVLGVAGVVAFADRPEERPIPKRPSIARYATQAARPRAEPVPRAPLPASTQAARSPRAAPLGGEIFLNTYYDFPVESGGPAEVSLFDARCRPIAAVPRAFHDRLCVQGSGRLASGVTVSFAARDCACAELCPKTGQRICYDALDPARFPSGRGAAGAPITPLFTVAVDASVIPLGTPLFIPELAGLPRPDGTPHDGCFLAEDQGIKVKGRRIDVFAGDAVTRRLWDASVPSNRGVHVIIDDPRCAARAGIASARARQRAASGGRPTGRPRRRRD